MHEPAGGGTSMNLGAGHAKVPARALPFTITVRADGYRPRTFGPYEPASAPPTLVATLSRSARIVGRIVAGGRPVPHARIMLCEPLAPGALAGNGFPLRMSVEGEAADTDPDGTFQVSIQKSCVRILVVQPFTWNDHEWAAGYARAELGPLELDATQDREMEIELVRGGRLEGHVLGFAPATSIVQFVSASRGDGRVLSTRIAADGSYALDHLTPGEWCVRPSEQDFTNWIQTAEAPPEPANQLVTIADETTTRLDLPLPPTSGAVLEGHLHIPGVEDGTWTAHLQPFDKLESAVSTRVGTDGSFRLEVGSGGRHHLQLRTVSQASLSCALDCDVELAPGTNEWACSTELGSISVTNPPVGDLELECQLSGGVTWTAQWRPTGPGQHIFAGPPAGQVRITGGGRVLADVTVRARENTPVVWN
jgi:hypothetical protein